MSRGQLMTAANLCRVAVGIFHNRNPSNLDSSDQQIRLCCDLISRYVNYCMAIVYMLGNHFIG